MFFGKNKNTLKLVKQHPNLLMGAVYHIIESAANPKNVKIGSGISSLYLRDEYGETYLVEGNAAKIKEYFQPVMMFENIQGSTFKLKRPVGSLLQNTVLKETTSLSCDEKIYLGNGITERYFIEKSSNKIIKFVGNSTQIKSLLEEQVQVEKPKEQLPKVIEKPVVQLIEKTIVKEIVPQAGSQGLPGERGEIGPVGPAGPQGPMGLQGNDGKQGQQGDVGPAGPQGERGPVGPKGDPGVVGSKGDKGDRGDKGDKGDKGDQGEVGSIGPMGPQGPQGQQGIPGKDGAAGEVGPEGPMGQEGPRGEKGEKGDRGPVGPQGPVGPRGEIGPVGPAGRDGESPVVSAEYPLILEEGTLKFDSDKLTKVMDQFKNADIQSAINKLSTAITPGGGGVGIKQDGNRIIKSVNDIDFTGSGVSVSRQGKNVTVNISGGGGTESGVSSLIAGSGITLSGSTGDVTITNLLSINGAAGSIQLANETSDGLTSSALFKYDLGTNTLEVPSILSLTAAAGLPSYIQFADGTTMGSAAQGGVSQIVAGSGISISPPSGTGVVTIDATGVAGGGVDSLLGLTGNIGITTGLGIDLSSSGNTLIFTNNGVLSFNGLTGDVTGVTTGSANTFGPLQTFTSGIDSVGGTFSALTTFNSGIVATGATLSGTVSITGVITPTADSDAANKAYVDNVASTGIHYHQPVILASTDSETFASGVTYDNGASGDGATLTKTEPFARLNVDGTDASNGQRILIRSASTQQWNGIYDVTEQGSGLTAWVLTRSADADNYHPHDQDGLGANDYFFVEDGNTLKGHAYICSVPDGITFGITPITFALFSIPPVYTAGTGLALTDLEFSNTGVLGINGSTGNITLAAGDGITLSSSAGTITISSTIWINMDGGNAFSVPIANFSLNGGTA